MASDEQNAISALTGFSLNHLLTDLSLPSGSNLTGQLGISGVRNLSSNEIYNDKWDDEDDGAVGRGAGKDYEDEVDAELQDDQEDFDVKMEEEDVLEEQRPPKRMKTVTRLVERPKTVYERFPGFEKGKVLDFTELLKGVSIHKSRISKRPFHVETVYPRRKEVPKGYLRSIVGDAERQVEFKRVEEVVASGSIEHDLRRAMKERENSGLAAPLLLGDRSLDLILLSNWEDQIVFEPDEQSHSQESVPADRSLTNPTNKVLESGAWTQSIIWNSTVPFRDFTALELNEEEAPEERLPAETFRFRKRHRLDPHPKDKFNLSNDNFYEVSKDGVRHRVRQTFGQLVVEHAYPAQKLQLPFYKTRLNKQEARSFHRPALQFPSNVELRFSKVRSAKKKKDRAGRKVGKGGNVSEGLHKTADLSLKDTSNYVLLEYSEEHPPILSNLGMGGILVNYYRKKNDKDEHVPKFDLGVPFVLEPQDESPFMKFGSVAPGQNIPALYNNLVRAPLFRHKPYATDFLLIKSTIKGDTKYYIREMKNLFVVGQTYPVTEVPGPHSRKITNTIKHRLQTIAFKLLAKTKEERLKISRLMKYFPDQNELQMRQRLKEFMEYNRRGPHQGFWRLKSDWPIPSQAEMLKMVTPEQVVLSESMQVGQRHLQDAGYGITNEVKDDDESNLSIEQQLAPWITTKNFLLATQAKAMLRLHGEGDPTGRGEAFSFVRVSMKDIFVKAGEDYAEKLAEAENRPKSAHRYNVAEQQLVYKSEIERIWKAQHDSLSRKDEPPLDVIEEDKTFKKPLPPQRQGSVGGDYVMSPGFSPPGAGPSAMPSPALSRGSSVDRERETSLGPDGPRRVLRIRRLVAGEWETEIVREPAVINAYLKKRQIIEEEAQLTNTLAPTGDADKDARAKKRLEEEIARMKKNQERRLHRKNAKLVKEGGTPMQINRVVKADTTRRCGHCGQVGHMKTNRKCPKWAEYNGAAPPSLTPASTSPPQTPTVGNSAGFQQGPEFSANNPGPSSIRAQPQFGYAAAVPSPLATSPPFTAPDPEGDGESSVSKLKLTLKKP